MTIGALSVLEYVPVCPVGAVTLADCRQVDYQIFAATIGISPEDAMELLPVLVTVLFFTASIVGLIRLFKRGGR
jgi:hypothetical protein